jgi:hypothetical protein
MLTGYLHLKKHLNLEVEPGKEVELKILKFKNPLKV